VHSSRARSKLAFVGVAGAVVVLRAAVVVAAVDDGAVASD
jgi:hypothetical protein